MDSLPIPLEQLIFLLIVLGAGFINWLKSKMEERQFREDDTPPDFDWEETPRTDQRHQRPQVPPAEAIPDLPPFLKRAIEALGVPEEALKPHEQVEERVPEVPQQPPVLPTARQKAVEAAVVTKAKVKKAAAAAQEDAWRVVDKFSEREKGLSQAERKALRQIVNQKADEKVYRIREKAVHTAVPVRSLLKPDNIRAAFILQEILGQPKGMPPSSNQDSDRF